MANLKNFKLLRKTIAEKEPEQIDLNGFWSNGRNPLTCGTAGCVAGWAAALAHPDVRIESDLQWHTSAEARIWLDIGMDTFCELGHVLSDKGHGDLFETALTDDHKQEALDRLDICIAYLEAKQNG